MKFFTSFKTTQKQTLNLTQKQDIVVLGSCFSENMESRFIESGFRCTSNPFGVIYNPISLSVLLELIATKSPLPELSIIPIQNEFSSLLTHSLFRADTKKNLQLKFEKAATILHGSPKVYVITLGTAWVYHHSETELDVANCHKLDNTQFSKRLLSLNAVNQAISNICNSIKQINSANQIIFTLSPVRHLRDGFVENQMSKSLLHLGVQQILETFRFHYFPSYEIMMDELRDYRFYESDLIHPNKQAIDHIWAYFTDFYMNKSTQNIASEILSYYQLKRHQVLSQHPDLIKSHENKVRQIKEELITKYPYLLLD